ncbi:hypothetical protein XarbCFBP8152_18015 [Xanthomonas arboricola]|nr:hypothetical protein XarbCFBP8152_18015 [Xanthomonas arboricola]
MFDGELTCWRVIEHGAAGEPGTARIGDSGCAVQNARSGALQQSAPLRKSRRRTGFSGLP